MKQWKSQNPRHLFLILSIIVALAVIIFLLRQREIPNSQEGTKEKPLIELLSPESLQRESDAETRIPDPAVSITDNPISEDRRTILRPEDRGEDFSQAESDKIMEKLCKGNKIEQRKAAMELWYRFVQKRRTPSKTEQAWIKIVVRRYLENMPKDFEENFLQLQRLWHLAAPALLQYVADPNPSISENAARMLSLMKTTAIIDDLIQQSDTANSPETLRKYCFALGYIKMNNQYFLDQRPRLSDTESKKLYVEKVLPQIARLQTKLQAMVKKRN